ncbi:enoyl-CoA hydratase-related protein [Pararhodobacter aggregans]|uniref:enoyl-CoA hydratase-related protein n=1 Tax=Pararhodobacter aggregans TaxID=404875 RepID=UPI003A912F05
MELKVETNGKVLEITLCRGEEGNALTAGMTEGIAAAVSSPAPEVTVILLKAEGPDFCTGRAPAMPPKDARLTANDLRAKISDPVLAFYEALRSAPVPVVARVQGRAAGVGCALAALADVAVAGRGAVFSVPEMNHDIAPTLVMDALVDRVPRAVLARLVLTRQAVTAAEAQAMGLVGVVAEDLDTAVAGVVEGLTANSPAVVRAVKAFLKRAPEASGATRRELAALLNAAATAERFR